MAGLLLRELLALIPSGLLLCMITNLGFLLYDICVISIPLGLALALRSAKYAAHEFSGKIRLGGRSWHGIISTSNTSLLKEPGAAREVVYPLYLETFLA